MSSIKLNHIVEPKPSQIADTLYKFLLQLGGPTVIHIKGEDSSSCRVITTLLHGNEPSGLKAIHRLLKEGYQPKVDTKVIVASVVAACTEPCFTHRMLEGQKDLNRCFTSDAVDLQSLLSQAIKDEINRYEAQAVIDIHNTSGSGPAFSVSVDNSALHLALASHFTHRLIFTDLRLGSIMEQNFGCPVITVEAGGAQDDEADVTAYKGIVSFLSAAEPFEMQQHVEQLSHPRRLEMKHASTIAYASRALEHFDIILSQDIEKLNFAITEAGQVLGWAQTLEHLQLDDNKQAVEGFFYIEDGLLKTRQALTMFMVTTRADIAKSDCLFYFVVQEH